jgi:hypothetical protein
LLNFICGWGHIAPIRTDSHLVVPNLYAIKKL